MLKKLKNKFIFHQLSQLIFSKIFLPIICFQLCFSPLAYSTSTSNPEDRDYEKEAEECYRPNKTNEVARKLCYESTCNSVLDINEGGRCRLTMATYEINQDETFKKDVGMAQDFLTYGGMGLMALGMIQMVTGFVLSDPSGCQWSSDIMMNLGGLIQSTGDIWNMAFSWKRFREIAKKYENADISRLAHNSQSVRSGQLDAFDYFIEKEKVLQENAFRDIAFTLVSLVPIAMAIPMAIYEIAEGEGACIVMGGKNSQALSAGNGTKEIGRLKSQKLKNASDAPPQVSKGVQRSSSASGFSNGRSTKGRTAPQMSKPQVNKTQVRPQVQAHSQVQVAQVQTLGKKGKVKNAQTQTHADVGTGPDGIDSTPLRPSSAQAKKAKAQTRAKTKSENPEPETQLVPYQQRPQSQRGPKFSSQSQPKKLKAEQEFTQIYIEAGHSFQARKPYSTYMDETSEFVILPERRVVLERNTATDEMMAHDFNQGKTYTKNADGEYSESPLDHRRFQEINRKAKAEARAKSRAPEEDGTQAQLSHLDSPDVRTKPKIEELDADHADDVAPSSALIPLPNQSVPRRVELDPSLPQTHPIQIRQPSRIDASAPNTMALVPYKKPSASRLEVTQVQVVDPSLARSMSPRRLLDPSLPQTHPIQIRQPSRIDVSQPEMALIPVRKSSAPSRPNVKAKTDIEVDAISETQLVSRSRQQDPVVESHAPSRTRADDIIDVEPLPIHSTQKANQKKFEQILDEASASYQTGASKFHETDSSKISLVPDKNIAIEIRKGSGETIVYDFNTGKAYSQMSHLGPDAPVVEIPITVEHMRRFQRENSPTALAQRAKAKQTLEIEDAAGSMALVPVQRKSGTVELTDQLPVMSPRDLLRPSSPLALETQLSQFSFLPTRPMGSVRPKKTTLMIEGPTFETHLKLEPTLPSLPAPSKIQADVPELGHQPVVHRSLTDPSIPHPPMKTHGSAPEAQVEAPIHVEAAVTVRKPAKTRLNVSEESLLAQFGDLDLDDLPPSLRRQVDEARARVEAKERYSDDVRPKRNTREIGRRNSTSDIPDRSIPQQVELTAPPQKPASRLDDADPDIDADVPTERSLADNKGDKEEFEMAPQRSDKDQTDPLESSQHKEPLEQKEPTESVDQASKRTGHETDTGSDDLQTTRPRTNEDLEEDSVAISRQEQVEHLQASQPRKPSRAEVDTELRELRAKSHAEEIEIETRFKREESRLEQAYSDLEVKESRVVYLTDTPQGQRLRKNLTKEEYQGLEEIDLQMKTFDQSEMAQSHIQNHNTAAANKKKADKAKFDSKREIDRLQLEKQGLRDDIRSIEMRREDIQRAQLDYKNSQKKVEDLNAELSAHQSKLAEAQIELDSIPSKRKELDDQIKKLENFLKSDEPRNVKYRESHAEKLASELQLYRDDLAKLTGRESQLKLSMDQTQSKMDTSTKNLTSAEDELIRNQSAFKRTLADDDLSKLNKEIALKQEKIDELAVKQEEQMGLYRAAKADIDKAEKRMKRYDLQELYREKNEYNFQKYQQYLQEIRVKRLEGSKAKFKSQFNRWEDLQSNDQSTRRPTLFEKIVSAGWVISLAFAEGVSDTRQLDNFVDDPITGDTKTDITRMVQAIMTPAGFIMSLFGFLVGFKSTKMISKYTVEARKLAISRLIFATLELGLSLALINFMFQEAKRIRERLAALKKIQKKLMTLNPSQLKDHNQLFQMVKQFSKRWSPAMMEKAFANASPAGQDRFDPDTLRVCIDQTGNYDFKCLCAQNNSCRHLSPDQFPSAFASNKQFKEFISGVNLFSSGDLPASEIIDPLASSFMIPKIHRMSQNVHKQVNQVLIKKGKAPLPNLTDVNKLAKQQGTLLFTSFIKADEDIWKNGGANKIGLNSLFMTGLKSSAQDNFKKMDEIDKAMLSDLEKEDTVESPLINQQLLQDLKDNSIENSVQNEAVIEDEESGEIFENFSNPNQLQQQGQGQKQDQQTLENIRRKTYKINSINEKQDLNIWKIISQRHLKSLVPGF